MARTYIAAVSPSTDPYDPSRDAVKDWGSVPSPYYDVFGQNYSDTMAAHQTKLDEYNKAAASAAGECVKLTNQRSRLKGMLDANTVAYEVANKEAKNMQGMVTSKTQEIDACRDKWTLQLAIQNGTWNPYIASP